MRLIKSLSLEEVEEYFLQSGEKKFRARCLFTWLYEKNVSSFDEMTDFSKALRQKMSDDFILSPLTLEDCVVSKIDGTEKYLFRTQDDHYIESVFLKNDTTDEGRLTICISSQVGCAMGCVFCQTAKLGFKRNLETGEILDQICQIRRLTGLKNNNIVFMGMGEPFMNYENVIKAATIMNYTFGFHISVRRITISTCGILPQIERFIDEGHLFNLALSLNDTLPEKRKSSMPVENKWPMHELASLFAKKLPRAHNRLTIEYVMRRDNISREDAARLKKMFRYSRIKLNLIPLNTRDMSERPGDGAINAFLSELESADVPVTVRKSLGLDIDGACGQLSGKKYDAVNSINS